MGVLSYRNGNQSRMHIARRSLAQCDLPLIKHVQPMARAMARKDDTVHWHLPNPKEWYVGVTKTG